MRLIEALETLRRPVDKTALRRRILLALGFTPLHLQTLLNAHLRVGAPAVDAVLENGLYGDLAGTLERADLQSIDAVVAVIEWSDLDSRLGLRVLGGWRPEQLGEIIDSAEAVLERVIRALTRAAEAVQVVVVLPTLPLPPLFTTEGNQVGAMESRLLRVIAAAGEVLARSANLKLLNPSALAAVSSPATRYDLKSDLLSGFPYTNGHADVLAMLLAELVRNRPQAKGLITDLDDTLWAGIAGDDGVEALSWNLDEHTQIHAIYQNLLASLAAAGVLLGVATKNDPSTVEQAFKRKDLLLPYSAVYPVEAHWSPKSQSIARILKVWNISADAVVFVDDNPIEIAEVQQAFPHMDCLLFPKNDYAEAWSFFQSLRNAFGKRTVTSEDALRSESIRTAQAWNAVESDNASPSDAFLAAAEAHIVFDCACASGDVRSFELINKTNQFNLNGKRLTDAEWHRLLVDPSVFLLTATYKDKFGPLGKIAVLLGRKHAGDIELSSWVMSCRAFSRRIEHQCLKFLFDHFDAKRIVFDYEATARNAPLTECLAGFLGAAPSHGVSLTREEFFARLPSLYHRTEVSTHV